MKLRADRLSGVGAREKVWSLNAGCYAWREDSDERPVLKYLTRDPEPGGPVANIQNS